MEGEKAANARAEMGPAAEAFNWFEGSEALMEFASTLKRYQKLVIEVLSEEGAVIETDEDAWRALVAPGGGFEEWEGEPERKAMFRTACWVLSCKEEKRARAAQERAFCGEEGC